MTKEMLITVAIAEEKIEKAYIELGELIKEYIKNDYTPTITSILDSLKLSILPNSKYICYVHYFEEDSFSKNEWTELQFYDLNWVPTETKNVWNRYKTNGPGNLRQSVEDALSKVSLSHISSEYLEHIKKDKECP